RLASVEDFENVVVRATPDGSIVRVRDVARVELGEQSYYRDARLNGRPAAGIAIYQLPGSNAVETMKAATKLMEEAKARFPHDLDYVTALDTTLAVSAGIHEIVKTLVEALVLVVIVVFIFLQGFRATLIPLLAVPVSLVGTFMVFPLLGFSINTLSLFGLVLAIGLVVDDAIVVVEAVEHHIERGLSPRDAALKAMHEVSSPVVAIDLVRAAVSGLIGIRLPGGFVPEEDQGYFYVNAQLPLAASLERTAGVMDKLDAILKDTPGVKYYTGVGGFSLLSAVSTTYNGFYFVSL